MKCVNALCLKQVNTAADVLYCPICQQDGTANEINPQRFPDVQDDTPIEEVLVAHPGIAVRYQPSAAAPDPEPEGQTAPLPESTETGGFVQSIIKAVTKKSKKK